jgi:hypothetical protein
MRMLWPALFCLLICIGCASAPKSVGRWPEASAGPDFGVQVVLSGKAKVPFVESQSWLEIDGWAFGTAKQGTPASWISEGFMDVWLKTIRLGGEGVAYFRDVRPSDKRLDALIDPDYAVNVNVHFRNNSHVSVAYACEAVTNRISQLQHRTHIITCKLVDE